MIDPQPVHVGRSVIYRPVAGGGPLQRGFVIGYTDEFVTIRLGAFALGRVAKVRRERLFWDGQLNETFIDTRS